MASPNHAPQLARQPLIVDRYAIYDEIASGGMATVHFARLIGAQGFRRTVAAKRLLPHLTRDHDFSLMLIDEARLAARIRHPNVVSTLDVVQTESELVLVMEYVHGESLSKLTRMAYQRGERVPLGVTAAILIDTLHGLHAAHEANDERGQPLGIVHRDISPQNLLVGSDGITRIADFGIAKAAGRSQTTRDGSVKGKLSYMAPEQLSQGEVTRTTDVFAATVVLWELLTGERLFEGTSQAESVFKVMSGPIPTPSSLSPNLPPQLDAIVARGLQRDSSRRFQTAREMALALEECTPRIRPSEIAAWVERISADSLARKGLLLAAIEHAPTELGDGPATEFLDVRASNRPPPGGEISRIEQKSELSKHVAKAQQRPMRPWVVALVLLLSLGAVAVLAQRRFGASFLGAPEAEPAPAPRVVSEPVHEPAPQFEIKKEHSVSGTFPTDQVAAPSGDAPTAEQAKKTVEAKPATVPLRRPDEERARTSKDKDREKTGTRRARPSRDEACDPPYSIDASGRRIFKVECME